MPNAPGIPGTIGEETKRIRWMRLEGPPAIPGMPVSIYSRCYRADTADGFLIAMVSQDQCPEGLLWHISVSHRDKANKPDRCPTWDELKHAAYRLIQEDVALVLVFPKRSEPYVDIHPTTLHLWQESS